MNKTVDENGYIILSDEEENVLVMKPEYNSEEHSIRLSFEGVLRTDVQVFLATELGFYITAHVKALTVDCAGITAISPGCFNELLKAKVGLQAIGSQVSFINKPECVLKIERYTKNYL